MRIKGHPTITRSFDTKGEAKSWAAEVEKEMRMGRYHNLRIAERITLAEAIDRYLERVSTNKRPNSEARDRISAKAIIKYFGQEVTLVDVDSKQVALYRDTRMKTVSPSTIQNEFALLSLMFNVANREWG